jgi:hypothetical protein
MKNTESLKMSNPLDTLVVVCAYAGDAQQVVNNMPCYVHHGCPVSVMSPTDAPIGPGMLGTRNAAVTCCHIGLKGWIGPQTLERQRLMLEAALSYPQQYFLFHDADSVCLSPKIPRYLYDNPDMVWSNEVLDTNPGESLLPKIALQPPYFFSRKVIEGMLKTADHLPTSYVRGRSPEGWPLPHPTQCIDHYMLQLACGSGFPHFNFHTGASFETTTQHGLDTMAELVRVHGRVLVHQVKTAEVLKRLLQEHKEYAIAHR